MQHAHVIRKMKLHVNTGSAADPFVVRSRSESLCISRIPGEIEKALARFQFDEVIEIPSIQIDVSIASWDSFEEEVLKQAGQKVTVMLQQILGTADRLQTRSGKTGDDSAVSDEPSVHTPLKLFIYFLRGGTLPWWADYSSVMELESDVITHLSKFSGNEKRRSWLRSFSAMQPFDAALKRLANQFSSKFILDLLQIMDEDATAALASLHQMIAAMMVELPGQIDLLRQTKTAFTVSIFYNLLQNNHRSLKRFTTAMINPDSVRDFIKLHLHQQAGASSIQSAIDDWFKEGEASSPNGARKLEIPPMQEQELVTEGESYFIHNAGLVLLHPFLERFFRHLQLINEDGIFKDGLRSKAVQLLQFLSTGKEDEPEFNMILSKVLCGTPLPFPVEKVAITAKDKEACDDLMKAVIGHWTALKNTSPAALQNMFLQREGKLEFKNEAWYLKTEQRTEDILLNRLPWSISRIKTPWMKYWLLSEWNN